MPNIYVKKIKNILTNNTSRIGKIKPKVPYFHFCCVLRKKKKKKNMAVRLQGEVNFHLIFDFINTASPPNFIRGKAHSEVANAIRFWLMARLFNNFLVADRPILEAADYAKSQITGCSLYFWLLVNCLCAPHIRLNEHKTNFLFINIKLVLSKASL